MGTRPKACLAKMGAKASQWAGSEGSESEKAEVRLCESQVAQEQARGFMAYPKSMWLGKRAEPVNIRKVQKLNVAGLVGKEVGGPDYEGVCKFLPFARFCGWHDETDNAEGDQGRFWHSLEPSKADIKDGRILPPRDIMKGPSLGKDGALRYVDHRLDLEEEDASAKTDGADGAGGPNWKRPARLPTYNPEDDEDANEELVADAAEKVQ